MTARAERWMGSRGARALFVAALLALGCTKSTVPDAGGLSDAGIDANGPDAAVGSDGGPVCGCAPGSHGALIYLLSQDAELWTFDPLTLESRFVVGPVCATDDDPFSMAIDAEGRAWMLFSRTRRVLTIDVNALAACEDSGYLPTVAELPLFGMSFLEGADGCDTLYGISYSGEGPFREGPGIGRLARIDGDPPRATILASVDYDGGELAGTGDGRLFAFAGVDPSKLVEYDPSDGAVLDVLPLDGLPRTNANAFAFFGGDVWFFTEAFGEDCDACFEANCASAWLACQADATCADQVECAMEAGDVSDACGGGAGAEMLECLGTCSAECLVRPRARVSRATRLDWDASDGPGRALTIEVPALPIRVVGAATSPCVPVAPD